MILAETTSSIRMEFASFDDWWAPCRGPFRRSPGLSRASRPVSAATPETGLSVEAKRFAATAWLLRGRGSPALSVCA